MKKTGQIILLVWLLGFWGGDANASEILAVTGTISTRNAHRSSFPDLAKASPVDAVKAALSAKNGKLLKLELQNEKGFLVYDIELAGPEKEIVDILVDAGSGEVLSIQQE